MSAQDLTSPIQHRLIELLTENGPMTRDEICEAFGFKKILSRNASGPIEQYESRTTIYDNLDKLQKRKIIEKFTKNNGKRGRSHVLFRLKN